MESCVKTPLSTFCNNRKHFFTGESFFSGCVQQRGCLPPRSVRTDEREGGNGGLVYSTWSDPHVGQREQLHVCAVVSVPGWFFRFLFCCAESSHFCIGSTGSWNALKDPPPHLLKNCFLFLKICCFLKCQHGINLPLHTYRALQRVCIRKKPLFTSGGGNYAACCWLVSRPTPLLFMMDVILCVSAGPVRAGFHSVQHAIFLLFFPLLSSPAKCPTLVSSSPSEHQTVLSPLSSQAFFFLHIFTLDAIICRSGSYSSNRSKKTPNVADVLLFNSHLIIKIFDCICIIFLSLHAPLGKNQNPSELCRGLMAWITFIISAKLVSLLTFAILGGVRRVHPSTELPEKTYFFIATLGDKKHKSTSVPSLIFWPRLQHAKCFHREEENLINKNLNAKRPSYLFCLFAFCWLIKTGEIV